MTKAEAESAALGAGELLIFADVSPSRQSYAVEPVVFVCHVEIRAVDDKCVSIEARGSH